MKTIPCLIWALFFLLAVSCSSNNGDHGNSAPTDSLGTDLSNLFVYRVDSPFAGVLINCVSITDSSESCSINRLRPIGFEAFEFGSDPTENIMNRVVVSHQWMGDRFQNLLDHLPDDILQLFNSVTAIVIDDDIRPAFYSNHTGAIYIDPAYLWLTNIEKSVINKKDDFRSDFGNELQFKRLWRYITNDNNAWVSYSLTGEEERQLADIIVPSAYLLYHELAHANDCLPPQELNNLDFNKSFFENILIFFNSDKCIHQRLTSQWPLTSSVWSGLADVLFHGESASDEQKDMTPLDVGNIFASDYALDTYSYSSDWEDAALLFEAYMMKLHFNADRDIAIVPYFEALNCDNTLIKWGQRGRVGADVVFDRSSFVVREIFPEMQTGLSGSPPVPLAFNSSYCINRSGSKKQDDAVDVLNNFNDSRDVL